MATIKITEQESRIIEFFRLRIDKKDMALQLRRVNNMIATLYHNEPEQMSLDWAGKCVLAFTELSEALDPLLEEKT